tara:strand:- start:353 stop:568 length:216 start_codon:yes stop_codon:yes gene_type:complete
VSALGRAASDALLHHSYKGKTMENETKAVKQSTGNRLKFKLEFMMMMLMADRNEQAAEIYNQLIEEFDKLA